MDIYSPILIVLMGLLPSFMGDNINTKLVEVNNSSILGNIIYIESEIIEVPSILDYNDSDIPFMLSNLKGTDKWNDLIYKVGIEEGIDPVFLKIIMTIESGGNVNAINKANKNGTIDKGLMQINSAWGSQFDYDRMFIDPEYAIRCGAKVIKAKIRDAKRQGCDPSAFEILWRYNGKSAQGKAYASKMIKLYEVFRSRDFNIVLTSE